ncbi:MAG TPA: cyclopropane-fatty-acyl-phospholipid synthase family protein [Actinospica sp.]|jgi:cyclopropane-fatty-acyl-phospholipid synthase|nr:cyclopropane-fatty-acyl-phospholipid synthase family protein [Actinospica sp.]
MPSRSIDPVAPRIARLYRDLAAGRDLPVGVRAWDGSHAGPAQDPTLVIASPRALRRLVWAPNELGLAQAYVTGELDVDGDVAEGLRRVWDSAGQNVRPPRVARPANLARLLAAAIRLRAVGPRPAAPASQARVRGGLHTLARDRAVIAHHYDLSNDFYALLLDGSMAYSSAYWTSDQPGYTLADAQRDKLDLICRKLELSPGMRLLDVGCGWGGLLMHAAEHHGVHGIGLTLSCQQAAYINDQLAKRGLAGKIEVRVVHFREFHEPNAFDAVASIEMGEHVGAEAYPVYTRTVHTSLKAGGRALIQQMSRAHDAAPGGGPFIESFIAPDMHMRPLPDTVTQWRATGFDLVDTECLRGHYVRTVEAWRANLEAVWPKVVTLVGTETARVWRLYLAGGQLAFEQHRMGVDQILLRKPAAPRI